MGRAAGAENLEPPRGSERTRLASERPWFVRLCSEARRLFVAALAGGKNRGGKKERFFFSTHNGRRKQNLVLISQNRLSIARSYPGGSDGLNTGWGQRKPRNSENLENLFANTSPSIEQSLRIEEPKGIGRVRPPKAAPLPLETSARENARGYR